LAVLRLSFFLVSTPGVSKAQTVSPGQVAGPATQPAAYQQRLRGNPDFFRFRDGWIRRAEQAEKTGSPLSGELPVLLIQGLFADSPEPHISHQDLQRALFDGPSPNGTLSEYYHDVSGGKLRLYGEALPWVRSSLTMGQVVGTSFGLGEEAMTGAYLFELAAAADEEVDYGRFDNDGSDGISNSGDDDGFVDAVAFEFLEVSASCGGPSIWPHRSRLEFWNEGQPYVTNDPRTGGGWIRVNDYTVQSATDCGGVRVQTATTIAHELGHVLGLPDLYDRSRGILPEERRWVVGCWSLMAAGSWGCGTQDRIDWLKPTHMGAWEKERLGWLGNVEMVGSLLEGEFTLDPVQSGERVLKIPLESGPFSSRTEYLLLEYRTREGFDQNLPSEGVLIYHVDPKVGGNQPCDTCSQVYEVELLEADGNDSLKRTFQQGGNRGEAGDAWGLSPPYRLSSRTNPSACLTSGAPSPVTVYGIELVDGRARITLSTLEIPGARLAHTFLESTGPGLTQEEEAFLDRHGNQNGHYDVGDLRAYLRR